MSFVYIVTEGSSDTGFLRTLLSPAIQRRARFVSGSGKSASISDARTILSIENRALALVLDADTSDRQEAKSERMRIRDLLGSASSGKPFEIFLAIPRLDPYDEQGKRLDHKDLIDDLIRFVKKHSVNA